MFKKVLLIALILFCSTAFGVVDTTEINFSTVTSGTFDQSLRRWIDTLNTDIANSGGLFGVGTGKIFYVDSGAGNSSTVDGLTVGRAFPTLDDAFDSGNATANRGDIIRVLQGHNEALTAGAVTVDIAGVTIVGLGNGTLTPTFDYDVGSGSFIVGAPNVTLARLRFRASITTIVSPFVVNASGDNASIISCDFGFAEAVGTDEFNAAITIFNGANNVTVRGCKLNSLGASAAVQGILLHAVSGFTLEDTDIIGDYSVACIKNPASAQDVIIRRNFLFNGTMGGDGQLNDQPALEMAELTSGFVADNRIVSDVATALLMRVADDMVFMNNYVSDTDGDEFSGTIATGSASGLTSVSVSGHIDG